MKHYTFHVYATVKMQFTFTEAEVEHDPDGDDTAVEPTAEALGALERELEEYLGQNYVVDEIEVSSDSDMILHDPREPYEG